VWQKLSNEQSENYVIYETGDEPHYAKVDSDGALQNVWSDQSGEFDDFEQHLEPVSG